ncbi:MAG TPA: hypothetical protein VK249_26700 [Anaerolineales bacterium]|nr:hypothetical protein [Anaerolineales bacterium]
MKPPINTRQSFSSADKTKIILVIIFLGILGVILVILLAFLFLGKPLSFAALNTETPVIPTMFIPTPDCGHPILLLGSSTFQIETIQPAADGSLSVPSDRSGVAYWVTGTNTNYMFVLGPTLENLAIMPTITIGTPAKVTWSNCNSTTYSLSAPQPGTLNGSTLPDQSADGITIFFETDGSGAGFVFKGELAEEQISTINTPSASEIQAEISLLETTTSTDGTTIRVGVSIHNYGASPFTLSSTDVSLTSPDGTALAITSREPALPKEIGAGATETIYFTFPHPSSPTVTLKIFEVEYELEGY